MAAPSVHHSGGTATGNVSDITVAMSPASGESNLYLLAWIFSELTYTMSSIPTWNSVNVPEIGTIAQVGTGSFVRSFGLVAPTADGSSHDFFADWDTTERFGAICVFLKDVNQSTPQDGVDDATITGNTSITNAVTSATGDFVVGACGMKNSSDPTYVPTGTQIAEFFGAGSENAQQVIASSHAGAASVDWGMSWTPSDDVIARCFNINAVAAASNPGARRRRDASAF